MTAFDGATTSWLRAHHGTISTSELRPGVSPTQIRWLVRTGVLERVVDGGYRFAGTPDHELARCAAVCASRPKLVIGGPTAGRLWGIRRSPRDDVIHVIASPASQPCREPWVLAYRTSLLHDDDVVTRADGIRLARPARTLVDLTRFLRAGALASAIEHGLSLGLVTVPRLEFTARRLATPGRPWARHFLDVLADRVAGAPRESDWELRVLGTLVHHGATGLHSQVHERLPGHGPARFDIADPDRRWVVEVDIHPEHRTLEGQRNDHRRDRRSRQLGYVVERVGESELLGDFAGTIADLAASHQRRCAEVDRLAVVGLWPPPDAAA